jgi:hypothetical protein
MAAECEMGLIDSRQVAAAPRNPERKMTVEFQRIRLQIAQSIFQKWVSGNWIGQKVPVVRPHSWDDALDAVRETFLVYADAALDAFGAAEDFDIAIQDVIAMLSKPGAECTFWEKIHRLKDAYGWINDGVQQNAKWG